jgi:Ca2+-binding RTX toxin-like protein
MAVFTAGSMWKYNSVKEGGGRPDFDQDGDTVTASFSNGTVYTLTAATPGSLNVIDGDLEGIVGSWSGKIKGTEYFSLSGISHDMDTDVYDDGYTADGISLQKLAAEIAMNLGGNDEITGSSRNDQLAGFAGDDIINGGKGKDKLTGGSGSDVFQFSDVGSKNADQVTDFVRGVDKIDLLASGNLFSQFADGISADMLRVATKAKAQDSNDFLLFDSASGKLYYDADGNGSGKAELIVTLMGVKDFDISDFEDALIVA